MVQHPAFAAAEVERLRATQLAEIQHELSSPDGLGERAMPPLLYGPASPYAKLAAGAGDPAAVKALTRDDLVAFHHAWIRPDKAKIFVDQRSPARRGAGRARGALRIDWKGEGPAGVKAFNGAPVPGEPADRAGRPPRFARNR